jgi:hypothetical protein
MCFIAGGGSPSDLTEYQPGDSADLEMTIKLTNSILSFDDRHKRP